MPSMGRYHRNIFQERKRYQSALLQRSDIDHPTYIIDADFRDWSDIVLRKTQRALQDLTQMLNSQGVSSGYLPTVGDSWKLTVTEAGISSQNFLIGGYRNNSSKVANSPEHCARAYVGGFAATLFTDTNYRCLYLFAGQVLRFQTNLADGIHRKYTSVGINYLDDDRALWPVVDGVGFFTAASTAGRAYKVRLYNGSYTINSNTQTRLNLTDFSPVLNAGEAVTEPHPSLDRYYHIELRAAGDDAETVRVFLDCHLEDHGLIEDPDLNHNPGGSPLESMRRTKLIQQVVISPPSPFGDLTTLSPAVDYTDLGGVRHYVREIGSFVLAAGADSPANAAAITNLVQPLGQDLRDHIADSTNPHGEFLTQDYMYSKRIMGSDPKDVMGDTIEGGVGLDHEGNIIEGGGGLALIGSLITLGGTGIASRLLGKQSFSLATTLGVGVDSSLGAAGQWSPLQGTFPQLNIHFDKTTFNKLALSDDTTRGGDVEVAGSLEVSPGEGAALVTAIGVGRVVVPGPGFDQHNFLVDQKGTTLIGAGTEPRLAASGEVRAYNYVVSKVSPASTASPPGNANGPCPVGFSSAMEGVQTWVDASDFDMSLDGVHVLAGMHPKKSPSGVIWGRDVHGVLDPPLSTWSPIFTYNLCNAYQGSKFGDTGTISFDDANGTVGGGAGYRFPDKAPQLTQIDFMFGVRYPQTSPAWAGIIGTTLVQFHLYGRNVDNQGREAVFALGDGRTAWTQEEPGNGSATHAANVFSREDLLTGGLKTSNICTYSGDYVAVGQGEGILYPLVGGQQGTAFSARVTTAYAAGGYVYQNVFVKMELSSNRLADDGMALEERTLRMRTPLKLVLHTGRIVPSNELQMYFAGCVLHAKCYALGGF